MFRTSAPALFLVLLLASAALLGRGQPPPRPAASRASTEAIRLNNLGVATMNQQKFEPALDYFQKAAAIDPAFATARLNEAIALINLQRYDDARGLLTKITADDAEAVRAWYNLGLLEKSAGQGEASLAAFERAAALAPKDAYSQYFVGLMAAQLQQYDQAIEAFTRALAVDPFLVSAEFGLARAFQRAGKADEAKSHLDRFQRLTTEKIASAMSLSYGDQGPYSLAEAVLPAGGATPPPIPVKFIVRGGPSGTNPAEAGAADRISSGCFVDADGNGTLEYVHAGPKGAAILNNGGGTIGDELLRLGDAAAATACAVGDVDNDERPDVVVGRAAGAVQIYRNEAPGRFTDITEATTIATRPGAVTSLTLVDFDHDGDLDLIVNRAAGAAAGGASPSARVWRNNGNGTFADVTSDRGFDALTGSVAATASDLNNDRAIDLIFTGAQTAVLINPRDGAFKPSQPFAEPMPSPTVGIAVLDFDKDGWMDLAFSHRSAPGVSLWKNDGGTRFTRVSLPDTGATSASGMTVVDYDNDGWLDLAYAATDAGRIVLLRNHGGTFADASASTGASALELPAASTIAAADLDGDNDADLVVATPERPVVVRNEGGNANHALPLTLKGLNDNRSGLGAKIEVQAGAIWQKFELLGGAGYLSQSGAPLLAGLGQEKSADVVRLLWPTGVVQDEVNLPAGKPATIEQIDRRGSSCPILFTWNGSRYEFITDAIGPAVVGHWVAPGERNVSDPDEYIKIDGGSLVARDGRLSVKFMEPMEEVIYLDQVRLVTVDHPTGTEVLPNEYFAATIPPPDARIFAARGARPPVGAWDAAGRDVLPLVRARDRRYVDGFAPAPFKGFAEPHRLDLDLGELPADAPVRLLMTGFTDYFTATSVFAAHQADITAMVPSLDAQLPDGRWVRVKDDIGFPAGLYRTMTADLTGVLPAGARRIRITTNLKVYWDQVLIDTTPAGAVSIHTTDVPLLDAQLAFRGFPREVSGSPAADLRYVYDETSRFGPWARHRGFYTRYGEVTPLLTAAEDRFVIFGAGEEVSLSFDARSLPPLPDGWTRDYLFYAHGYVKDMDFYAAHAQTVAPLPFAAMSGYPYRKDEAYPDRNRGYLLDWNTREVTAESWPSYRAEYRRR